jgi:hypothetical protein
MDENKRKKLKEIGYEIHPSCGMCQSGIFEGVAWGTCKKHTYEHLKHTEETRELSIFRHGVCPEFGLKLSAGIGPWFDFWTYPEKT